MLDWLTTHPALTGAAAVVTALTILARPVWRLAAAGYRLARRVADFLDDWTGEPKRPGVPERPGVMARLAALETSVAEVRHEVQHNNGGSLKDAMRRTEQAVGDLAEQVQQITDRDQ